MSDWKPNVSAPIWHQETQPFEFETRSEAKLAKLQHHTITQIFINIFSIYIQYKTFKNIIEHLVVTRWNIKIVNYENQMTQLPL
jgi:hypothetical protein